MTYHERCRAIAEQMARKQIPAFDQIPENSQKEFIDLWISLAEIAVQFGAQCYDLGTAKVITSSNFYTGEINRIAISKTKTDLGLVKPNDIQVNEDQ